MKKLIVLLTMVLGFAEGYGQIINEIESLLFIHDQTASADNSAILNVDSQTRGILIPRLSSIQRSAIALPAAGLLVYDITTTSFWYYDNSIWNEISPSTNGVGIVNTVDNMNGTFTFNYSDGSSFTTSNLTGPMGQTGPVGPPGQTSTNLVKDADGDTTIDTEKNSDEDIIRFKIDGQEQISFKNNGQNLTRLDIANVSKGVFVGHNSGLVNETTGLYNTFLGYISGLGNTTGDLNTFVGYDTGRYGATLNRSTFVGAVAGSKLTVGNNNSIFGYAAGSHIDVGSENTIIGANAASGTLDNQRNVVIGSSAGWDNDGDDNVLIGFYAGGGSTSSGCVQIGKFAGNLNSTDNRLYIDNSGTTMPLVYGEFENNKFGINWLSSTPLPNTLSVNGEASKSTAGDWLANSDSRLKKNIKNLNSQLMLSKLLALQGVEYEWSDNKTGYERPLGKQYGFIAQNLEKIFPENVSKDSQGFLQTAYGTYDYLYVEAIKALHSENEELKKKLLDQGEKIFDLNKSVNSIINILETNNLVPNEQ